MDIAKYRLGPSGCEALMTLRSPELQSVEDEIDRLTLAPGRKAAAPEGTMLHFANIVVAIDGSESAKHARDWAAWCAAHEDAQVHLVSALGPPPYSYDSGQVPPMHGSVSGWQELMAEERADADEVLEDARRSLSEDVEATTEVAIGSPASVVSSIAESRGADLVICGSHDGGAVERLLLGSVADGIKHHAPCSVLIAKRSPTAKPLLLPTDGSGLSRSAVMTGVHLATELGTDARILHVIRGRPDLSERGYEEALRAAEEAGTARTAPERLPSHISSQVAFGEPAQVIVQQAERMDASLVVMGSRGLGGFTGRMLGSVSNQVSHKLETSVLFVKPSG